MNPLLAPGISHPWYLALSALADKVAVFAPRCTGTVVDYGCGTKPYRSLFTSAARFIGADLTAKEPEDVALRADFGLPLADGSVDAVLSTQVLEHVPDVEVYLAECRRVLRPGGKLLLSTHGTWVHHPAGEVGDFWRWTHSGLARDVERAGFRVLALEPACEGWACIAQQAVNAMAYDRSGFGPVRRALFRLFCAGVNTWAFLGMRLAPRRFSRGPTLPINYVVFAEK